MRQRRDDLRELGAELTEAFGRQTDAQLGGAVFGGFIADDVAVAVQPGAGAAGLRGEKDFDFLPSTEQ